MKLDIEGLRLTAEHFQGAEYCCSDCAETAAFAQLDKALWGVYDWLVESLLDDDIDMDSLPGSFHRALKQGNIESPT